MKKLISFILALTLLLASLVLAGCSTRQEVVLGTCSKCGKECYVPKDAPSGWIAICEECDAKIAGTLGD